MVIDYKGLQITCNVFDDRKLIMSLVVTCSGYYLAAQCVYI